MEGFVEVAQALVMPELPFELDANYRVVAFLGDGGQGTVFEGWDKNLKRRVAIKTPRYRNPHLFEEGQRLAKIKHPNVPEVFGTVTFEGRDYLILEYIEGTNLYKHVSAPLSPEETIRIATEVATALASTHQAGIIHGDLTPGNIMITPDGHVKVLDFGLGQRAEGRAPTGSMLTNPPRGSCGTRGYQSPEHINGSRIGARSDIFCLGSVMHYCLTLCAPFGGPNVEDDTCEKQPDFGALHDVPDGLTQLIRDCLEKDPAERPDNAEAVRSQLVELAKALDAPSNRAPRNRRIPALWHTFIGREREIEAIQRAVADPYERITSVIGIGGIGKTALVLRAAADLQETGDRQIYFADLSHATDQASVERTIANALDIPEEDHGRTLDAVCEALDDKAALLILDKCDKVRPECTAVLQELIPRATATSVLLTSRRTVCSGAEIHVGPLDTTDNEDIDTIKAQPAVRLFLDRARWEGRQFEEDADALRVISRICHRLAGIPLAIEITAARLGRPFTLDSLSDRVAKHVSRLSSGGRTTAAYETLEECFGWSYDDLSIEEAELLRRLRIFHAGWTIETAKSVCADQPSESHGPIIDEANIESLVLRLWDCSWFVFDRDEERYIMLEPVREYLEERRAPADDTDARVYRQHLEHALGFVRQRVDEQFSPKNHVAVDAIDREHDNIVGAIEAVADRQDLLASAIDLAVHTHRMWLIREHRRDGRAILQTLLHAGRLHRADPAPGQLLVGRAWNVLGIMMQEQEDHAPAIEAFEQSLAVFREMNDEVRQAGVLNNLVISYQNQRAFEKSRKAACHAIAFYEKHAHKEGVAATQLNLAACLLLEGRLDDARQLLTKILPDFRKHDDKQYHTSVAHNLAEIAFQSGDLDSSRSMLLEAIEANLTLKSPLANARNLLLLAGVAAETDEQSLAASVVVSIQTRHPNEFNQAVQESPYLGNLLQKRGLLDRQQGIVAMDDREVAAAANRLCRTS